MSRKQVVITYVITLLLTLSVMPSTQARGIPIHLTIEEGIWLAKMREAGLHGDATAVPQMLDALRKRSHPLYHTTLLHALARLGATQALSLIDDFAMKGDPEAMIARARLIAEDTAHANPALKISRFCLELGWTSSQINEEAKRPYIRPEDSNVPKPPAGLLALREIADMVYHGDYKVYAQLPEIKELDFKSDYPSALKMKLAPLDRKERIIRMMEELSHLTSQKQGPDYAKQLALDEGTEAGRAAADKLRELDAHRDQTDLNDFSSLLDLVLRIDYPSRSAFLKHFATDPDPDVSSLLKRPEPSQFAIDY